MILGSICLNCCQNRTQDGWVRSVNATSVLCRHPSPLWIRSLLYRLLTESSKNVPRPLEYVVVSQPCSILQSGAITNGYDPAMLCQSRRGQSTRFRTRLALTCRVRFHRTSHPCRFNLQEASSRLVLEA